MKEGICKAGAMLDRVVFVRGYLRWGHLVAGDHCMFMEEIWHIRYLIYCCMQFCIEKVKND